MYNLATLITEKASVERPVIYYMAVAPNLFRSTVQMISNAGLVDPQFGWL